MATTVFVDMVKVIERPSEYSGWYVVEGSTGRYHVSMLGGRAAKGFPDNATLKLYHNIGKQYSSYTLQR